jgi:rRNA maturation protein Nop10
MSKSKIKRKCAWCGLYTIERRATKGGGDE